MTNKDQHEISKLYTESFLNDEGGGAAVAYPDPNEDYKKFAGLFTFFSENLRTIKDNLHRIDQNKSGLDIENIDKLITQLIPLVNLTGRGSVNSFTTHDKEKMKPYGTWDD